MLVPGRGERLLVVGKSAFEGGSSGTDVEPAVAGIGRGDIYQGWGTPLCSGSYIAAGIVQPLPCH